ncbi:hypothetical protein V2J09_006188, partial [Rumex salicifolius]
KVEFILYFVLSIHADPFRFIEDLILWKAEVNKIIEKSIYLEFPFKIQWGNMGQKINPLGFKLGTSQSHYSIWFAQPKNYSEGLQEDKKIQDSIKNYAQ